MDQHESINTFCKLEYAEEALKDAERLLKFASESGRDVDKNVRNHILHARSVFQTGLDEQVLSNLLDSLAKLAYQVRPVSAESLTRCREESRRHRRPYQAFAFTLAVVVVAYSIASFVASAIAESLRNDITTANALAVKLGAELASAVPVETNPTAPNLISSNGFGTSAVGPTHEGIPRSSVVPRAREVISQYALPPGLGRADVIRDLQQYAISIRNIDVHALELSWYTNPRTRLSHPEWIDPFHYMRHDLSMMRDQFELPVPIANFTEAATERTKTYQQVRCFAQTMVDQVSFYYGAVSSCMLPVLYALLGAAAYLLRNFEQKVNNRTYVPSPASDYARFFVAAIGGVVVGLFSNLTGGQGVRISPLAFAFLLGYSVDVFYAFLESLIQSLAAMSFQHPTNATYP